MQLYTLPIIATVFAAILAPRPWRSGVIVVSLIFALFAEDLLRRHWRR